MKSVVVVCLSSHDDASCTVENMINVKERVIFDRLIGEVQRGFFFSLHLDVIYMFCDNS